MSKLLAAVFAAMFALGTVSAFAGDAAPKIPAAKVDCKDTKNKDVKECVDAAKKAPKK